MRAALLAVLALAVLLAGCGGTASHGDTGLSPAAKRILAKENAFDHAHPGLVSCEADIEVLISESATSMKDDGQAISPLQADEKYSGTVVPSVYPYFRQTLIAYVASHGLPSAGIVPDITDGGRRPNVLQSRCLSALTARAAQPTTYPTPTPDATGPSACPGSAALMTAWNVAPASTFQARSIAPGLQVSGFNNISCWHGWVVADPITNANGSAVFGSSGGLHLLSSAEIRQFNSAVCAASTSPTDWKSETVGVVAC
jgi:hypothetical protein